MKPAKCNQEPPIVAANPPDSEVDHKVIFQSLSENRDAYFVQYTPARVDGGLAVLSLTFVDRPSISKIVTLMESECRGWLNRFPVPIHVMAFDDTDSVIRPHEDKKISYLLGLPAADGIELHWRGLESPQLPIPTTSERQLLQTYTGIPHTTIAERKQRAAKMARSYRLGWFLVVVWLAGVPLGIAVLGLANPAIGFLCALYSICTGIVKALELLGYKEKSARKKEEGAKEAKMQHYYHHCELNPEGFNRIKLENFRRTAREETINEKRKLEQNRKDGIDDG